MKIYTRTGDGGQTDLLGGDRVGKDDLRIEATGALDELNAALGLCRAAPGLPAATDALLAGLQAELLHAGADLAAPRGELAGGLPRLGPAEAAGLEAAIDRIEAGLPPLRHFILPAGTSAAAALHLARTIARRAERRIVAAGQVGPVNPHLLIYVNRLSDLLFVLARQANVQAGSAEEPWTPRA